MIKAREWPVRAMYILIAAALAISLFITAAPAQRVSAAAAVEAKWTRVSTPTTEDFVLAPNSTIVDYALGDAGDVAYAIVYGRNVTGDNYVYWLLKSEDGAATWDDITDALEKVRKTETITELMLVATDWEDAEFVAVALVENSLVRVFVSKDGGTTFKDAGQVLDVVYFDDAEDVSDLAVSLAGADGQRDIAIGGSDDSGYAALFRCTVTGDSASAWHDTTVDTGWDNWYAPNPPAFTSILVTDIIFSPSWETDRTILAVTVTPVPMDGYDVHLQSGTFGETSVAWNKDAGFVNAVLVKDNVGLLIHPLEQFDPRGIAGVALPNDYAGDDPLKRYAWVWVNYIAVDDGLEAIGEIIRVKDGLHTSVREQIGGRPWLTNVSYWGSIAEGKAIAGVLGDGTGGYAVCCDGIQIYHKGGIKDMDICCPAWEPACKLPTGRVGMAVSYVSADKAYAVALQGTVVLPSFEPYDESAWSVSVDGDGIIWNQLSLVDTEISYLSDVAVSPDCNKMMLVSVNAYDMMKYCQCRQGCTGCDSVWLYAEDLPEAEEYSGHWLRTWCGRLVGVNDDHFADHLERGLLRLAPEEDNGDTVYLVDRMTSTIYYNDLETWNCWEKKSAATEISYIVDLAVKDASTIYALGYDGSVAMSDNHGAAITWTDAVKSGVTNGWTIAVRNSDVLVGGQNGDWNYSDDAGETWMKPAPKSPGAGLVTVAFDSYFDTNNVIYAALALGDNNGIYRWVIGESEKWETISEPEASSYDFTGLVLGFKGGNLHSNTDTGGVLYASYVNHEGTGGVARSLNPAETIACLSCVEWDYLTVGLTGDEYFIMGPQPLKICGCKEQTTNTKLFAIGVVWDGYDMTKAQDGTVWTFEDCYAKQAPTVTLPTGNTTIPADPCSCYNAPFTIKYDPLCDACYYEIEFALDEAFTALAGITLTGKPPVPTSVLVRGGEGAGAAGLSCETTYYLRVRATQAGTGQVIHSWWSKPLKITIAPSVGQAKINLNSPALGATDVGTKNVGFSWSLLASADKFDWKLSTNADFSGTLVDSKTVTTTACTYTKTTPLTYDTTYYWQVTASKGGVPISTSAVGTFTTAAQGPFCCPVDGLCFDTAAALTAHTADAHPAPATPFWVWVVIAIGAVLVIVVIVLIFRTRRV